MLLRYDTPAELVEFDRQCDEGGAIHAALWVGGFLSLFLAILAFVFAMPSTDQDVNVAVGLAVFPALFTLGVVYFLVQRRRLRPWQVRPKIGGGLVADAQHYYHQLAPENRDRAVPLLAALYRLADTEVVGRDAYSQVYDRMQLRVVALKELVDAEDRLRLAVASPTVDDDDDLTELAQWQQAMAEVEANMGGPLEPAGPTPTPTRTGRLARALRRRLG